MVNRKILIISDSVIDRSIIREYLGEDYIVYETSSGTDALDFLHTSSNTIDVIILDITMPTMNGRQFLKVLHNNPELKAISVLTICPKDDIDNEVFSLANGASDVIFKPFKKEVVISRINNIYNNYNPLQSRLENSLFVAQRETQNQLQGIMDNMDGGVAMIEVLSESETKVVFLNNGFYDLFNFSKNDIEKESINIISSKLFENEKELSKKINRSLITKEKFTIETKAYQKNGNEIYVQIQGSLLANQKSDFPVVLLIIYDISDLKSYENELIQMNKKLKYRANYDILTNIYNRDAFLDGVKAMIDANPNRKYVLIAFNFNKFKAVNEILGTKVGDEVLKHFADCMKRDLDGRGAYGRIEADHFACFIDLELFDESDLIYQLDHCFDSMQLNHKILISGGVYIIKDPKMPASQMLDRANLAIQENKHNYLNRINYYDDNIHSSLLEEQEVIAEMQDALRNHEFEIHLQAIYSIDARCITKAEALVRWNHPKKGLIYPSKFIPIFEKNGFITELDYYVWEEACKYIRSRKDRGLEPIDISVNISRLNVYRSDLADTIYALTQKYDVSPAMLDLEITESAYSNNPEMLQQTIKKLRQKGFTVLMDDFGSGYSSLNALKDLSFDILKIDMKFLEDFEVSHKTSSILSSIVRMAKKLNMGIVAEGVETTEQLNFLTNINCDLIQGYLFSKPVSIKDFESKPLYFKKEEKLLEGSFSEYNFLYDDNENTKKVFDILFGGFVVIETINDDFKIINYNQNFLDILGYKDYDINMQYKNFYNILYSDDIKLFKDDIHYAIETKKLHTSKLRAYNNDGVLINIIARIYVLKTDNEKSLVSIAIIPPSYQSEQDNIDIAKNRSMIDVIPAKVVFAYLPAGFEKFSDFKVLYSNNDKVAFNGYSNEDYYNLIKDDFFYFVHPDDKPKLLEVIKNFYETKLPSKLYYRLKVKENDEYKWVAIYLKFALEVKGNFYFSYALLDMFNLKDVSMIKGEGNFNYTVESYLRRFYDDYPDMLLQLSFVDGRYKISFANRKFLDYVGFDTMKDFVKKFDEEQFPFVSQESKVNIAKKLSEVYETGNPWTTVIKFHLNDGTYSLVSMAVARIVNYDDNYILHVLLSDISAESKREAEVELNKFVSIFGSVYESIYECDMDTDTYVVLKSPYLKEGTRGENIKKTIDNIISEFVYEEDVMEANNFMSKVYLNDEGFEKETTKLRIYRNDEVTYGLFNVTRISKTVFMFAYSMLDSNERVNTESIKELNSELLEAKASERLYKNAVEGLGVGLIRFTSTYSYISPILSNYNIFKCRTINDIKNSSDIVHEGDREIYAEFFDTLENTGKAQVEIRLRTFNDEYYYNVLALNKIIDNEGFVNYYGFVKDIHKIKLFNDINAAKKKSCDERIKIFNNLFNNLPVGVGVYEMVGNKIYPVYLSNNLISIMDIPYSTIDLNIKQRMPVEEVSDKLRDKLLEYAALGKIYHYRRYIEVKEGVIKWISVALHLIDNGDKLTIFASTLDLTDSATSQNAQVNKTNYLRQLVENSDSIYYEYDIKEDVISYFTLVDNDFTNKEIKHYYKYLNKTNLIQDEYKKRVFEAYKDITSKKKSSDTIECFAKFFKEYQWFKISLNAIFDEQGNVAKITGQVININNEIIRRNEYLQLIERDQLSGLFNRMTAQKNIVSLLTNASQKYVFMMMDIDHFKSLNDNFGHPMGDKVIKKVASAIQEEFSDKDAIVGRFGGDEFSVFFAYKDEDREEIDRRLLEFEIKAHNISKELDIEANISMSIGIAISPQDANTFDDLFLKADEALYMAKSAGKNTWRWYK